jgi:hypothetical protein
VYAREARAREMHAREAHAHELSAKKVSVREVPVTGLRPFGVCPYNLGGTVKACLGPSLSYRPHFGYYSRVRRGFSYAWVTERFSCAGPRWQGKVVKWQGRTNVRIWTPSSSEVDRR